jgi:hypothetical protein
MLQRILLASKDDGGSQALERRCLPAFSAFRHTKHTVPEGRLDIGGKTAGDASNSPPDTPVTSAHF